jgi:long-chain acyl-CoA synthetase
MVETGVKAVFCDPWLLPKLNTPLHQATNIQHVIYFNDREAKQDHVESLRNEHERITVQSWDDLIKLGENNHIDAHPPKPEDVFCIMYTSGSTGTPKGVILRHSNLVAASTFVI